MSEPETCQRDLPSEPITERYWPPLDASTEHKCPGCGSELAHRVVSGNIQFQCGSGRIKLNGYRFESYGCREIARLTAERDYAIASHQKWLEVAKTLQANLEASKNSLKVAKAYSDECADNRQLTAELSTLRAENERLKVIQAKAEALCARLFIEANHRIAYHELVEALDVEFVRGNSPSAFPLESGTLGTKAAHDGE
jgi:hypothetical protein